jgi:hypothetical protein
MQNLPRAQAQLLSLKPSVKCSLLLWPLPFQPNHAEPAASTGTREGIHIVVRTHGDALGVGVDSHFVEARQADSVDLPQPIPVTNVAFNVEALTAEGTGLQASATRGAEAAQSPCSYQYCLRMRPWLSKRFRLLPRVARRRPLPRPLLVEPIASVLLQCPTLRFVNSVQ